MKKINTLKSESRLYEIEHTLLLHTLFHVFKTIYTTREFYKPFVKERITLQQIVNNTKIIN